MKRVFPAVQQALNLIRRQLVTPIMLVLLLRPWESLVVPIIIVAHSSHSCNTAHGSPTPSSLQGTFRYYECSQQGGSFMTSANLISPCSVIKVCGVFSKRVLA